MSDMQIVKMDQGGANARIIAKEAKADFRRVEAASLKIPSRFTSADGKRYFVRLFNTLQLNTHFISVIARTRLDHDDIVRIETAIRARMAFARWRRDPPTAFWCSFVAGSPGRCIAERTRRFDPRLRQDRRKRCRRT